MAELEPKPDPRPASLQMLFLRLCTTPGCVECDKRKPTRTVRHAGVP